MAQSAEPRVGRYSHASAMRYNTISDALTGGRHTGWGGSHSATNSPGPPAPPTSGRSSVRYASQPSTALGRARRNRLHAQPNKLSSRPDAREDQRINNLSRHKIGIAAARRGGRTTSDRTGLSVRRVNLT